MERSEEFPRSAAGSIRPPARAGHGHCRRYRRPNEKAGDATLREADCTRKTATGQAGAIASVGPSCYISPAQ